MNFAIRNLNDYLRFAPAILQIITSRVFQIIINFVISEWILNVAISSFLKSFDLRKSTNFFISPMDFIEEPFHIQDIIPKIIEFLKGKKGSSIRR